MSAKFKEKAGEALFALASVLCIVALLAIFVFLIIKSVPAFEKIGFFSFVFEDKWMPNREDTYGSDLSGTYGIFTMIAGTLASTAGALLIGGILGYFTAVFIVFYCPKKLKRPVSTVINLLAGIPSVVYGFFGIAFLLPLLSNIAPNNGSGLLATSIILGIMILPSVVSLSKTSLEAVPRIYYEGALALGTNHTRAVFKVMVPCARGGIIASLVLGIGRALGETMAVVMVAGNSVAYPHSLFNSFRVMTANIVMEMGYAGEVQEGALVSTGVILMLFVLIVNLIFNAIASKAVKAPNKNKQPSRVKEKLLFIKQKSSDAVSRLAFKVKASEIGGYSARAGGIIVSLVLALIIGFVAVNGIPYLLKNPYLVFGKYEFGSQRVSIFPSIICTVLAVVLSLSIATPIGIATAIFLNEYTAKSSLFVRLIRMAISILSGVPSIIYGLFGLITFVRIFGGSSSVISGSLTISIMLLPTIVRTTNESLKNVPTSLREASLALGAGKMRTIFKVVLPCALPGILSAVILSIGRVVSESAPLLYTMGSTIKPTPKSLLDGGATLSVALYRLASEGWYINEAYATAAVLIILVLGLNLTAELVGNRLGRKLQGDKNEEKRNN
ncbi:MAG: phosphate ABC transporter permease subunit PstC [Ruminococcaceae bacterium]|nr:phosphate ABC transporter permease subunit PstC [Oscillospiraceae bacterium]